MLSPRPWQLLGAGLCLGAEAGRWVVGGSLLQPRDPAKQAWDLLCCHTGVSPAVLVPPQHVCGCRGLEPRVPPPAPKGLLPASDLILVFLAIKQPLTEESSSLETCISWFCCTYVII